MKTVFLFPFLFLVIFISEHQAAVLEDCDEDDDGPNSNNRNSKLHPMQQGQKTLGRSQMKTFNRPPRPQQQENQRKRQHMPTIRKTIKMFEAPSLSMREQKRRQILGKRFVKHRRPRPMVWPSKPKPVNVLLKPIVPKPYKKQKRIKFVPAFDEYDTYPEANYLQEFLYPESRTYDYMEMESSPGLEAPCDTDDDESDYRDLSTEIQARDMDKSSEKVDEVKEVEVTTPVPAPETTPQVVARKENPLERNSTPERSSTPERGSTLERSNTPERNSSPEPVNKIMEIVIRGILALIECMKKSAPTMNEVITNVIKSCNNTLSS